MIPWTVAHQASLSMGFPRQEYWGGWSFPSPVFGGRAVLTGGDRTVSATISAWMLSFPHDDIFSIRIIPGACNRTCPWMLPQPVTESLVMKSRDTFCSHTAQMILCTRELERPTETVQDRAAQDVLPCRPMGSPERVLGEGGP